MGRDKITEKAKEQSEQSDEDPEIQLLSQRMPEPMVENIDTWREQMGMSRNAAINFLVREALKDRNAI
jgi:hypothetical protein